MGVVHAIEGVAARRGDLKAADEPDEGGFAGAVAPHKAVNRAFGHVHGEIIQGLEVLVMLGQALCGEHIFHKIASISLDEAIIAGKGQESGEENGSDFVQISTPLI